MTINGASAVMAYDFRSTCDALDSQLACGEGTLVDGRVRNVAPGDYYLVLESPDPANFTVQLDPLPRTVPMPVDDNDTCGNARSRSRRAAACSPATRSTLLNDYEALCGGNARSKDAAFHLTLPAARARQAPRSRLRSTPCCIASSTTGRAPPAASRSSRRLCNDDGGQGDHNSLLDRIARSGQLLLRRRRLQRQQRGQVLVRGHRSSGVIACRLLDRARSQLCSGRRRSRDMLVVTPAVAVISRFATRFGRSWISPPTADADACGRDCAPIEPLPPPQRCELGRVEPSAFESLRPRVPLLASYLMSQCAAGAATVVDFVLMVLLGRARGDALRVATGLGAFAGGATAFIANRHWSFAPAIAASASRLCATRWCGSAASRSIVCSFIS